MNPNRSILFLTLLFVCASAVGVRSDNSPRRVSAEAKESEPRHWEGTGPWGGDVRAMVASPADSNVFYLGTADGQIFQSVDAARTWRRLKPGLDKGGLSVDDIVIDPRNPQTIYAGAWAVAHDEESGVFKSTDGGQHWWPCSCRRQSHHPHPPRTTASTRDALRWEEQEALRMWRRSSSNGSGATNQS